MPEWDDKKKVWRDWVGAPISEARRAEDRRSKSYIYDLANLSRGLSGKLRKMDPKSAGTILGGLKQNLQQQYYKETGLPSDYIAKDVAGMEVRGRSNVANILGKSRVDAVRAGKETDPLLMSLLSEGDTPAPTVKRISEDDVSSTKPAVAAPPIAPYVPPDYTRDFSAIPGAGAGAGATWDLEDMLEKILLTTEGFRKRKPIRDKQEEDWFR